MSTCYDHVLISDSLKMPKVEKLIASGTNEMTFVKNFNTANCKDFVHSAPLFGQSKGACSRLTDEL